MNNYNDAILYHLGKIEYLKNTWPMKYEARLNTFYRKQVEDLISFHEECIKEMRELQG